MESCYNKYTEYKELPYSACVRTYSMIQAIPSNDPDSQLGELRFVKEVMTAATLLPKCSKGFR